MAKSRVRVIVFLLVIWAVLQGVQLWLLYGVAPKKTDPKQPTSETSANVEVLAQTPEGVMVYKIKQPELIVPAYVAVAPGGSVAITR